jgi:hypothetical protein
MALPVYQQPAGFPQDSVGLVRRSCQVETAPSLKYQTNLDSAPLLSCNRGIASNGVN